MWSKNDYYMWLLEYAGILYDGHELYNDLIQYLFAIEFEYAFVMDENRAKAGETLRTKFASEAGVYVEEVKTGPCTVLEMLIALADAIAFDTGGCISDWFWEMMDNLDLTRFDDDHFDQDQVEARVSIWMYRLYDSNGLGSLFPVVGYKGDMRKLEIWDQKNIYISTKYPVGKWIE